MTAYDQYAIQAFRYAALDYLLKPVTWEQLKEAVSRVGSYHPIAQDDSRLDILMHNLRDGLKSPRIVLPSSRGMDLSLIHILRFNVIEWIVDFTLVNFLCGFGKVSQLLNDPEI